MGKLVYAAICSLDGFVADEQGDFTWAAPDEEVHAAVNDIERAVGTQLYGRRMYDTLAVWETMESDEPVIRDFAEIWRGADKVVYSRTLEETRSARTRIEREFDPEAVRALKESADGEISIGGPELAGQAMAAGLVDELHLFVNPVIVGAGNPALPSGARVRLELLGERRFASGVVQLHYAVCNAE
ncbi:MAG TPA: dihydrofolate reductase family protein [Thermoleophilaceae bacterium]|nr:dihydrofolate reductase family protein [Thermoleophilaceae bacterium]